MLGMCVILTEWQKGKLTEEEALKNLSEIANLEHNIFSEEEKAHFIELEKKILYKEFYETYET
jgi:hypothetical protein